MKLKFWGARGSSPVVFDHSRLRAFIEKYLGDALAAGLHETSAVLQKVRADEGRKPLTFGGHTPCTEVTHGGQHCFVDMGTGLRESVLTYVGKRTEFNFFMTHLHWDHLMGLPFFVPVFIGGNKIVIHHVHRNAPEFIRLMFNGVNFPVRWDQLEAQIEFRQLTLYQKVEFGSLSVTPFALDHPGGSFGYRFEADGKSLVVGFDGEYTRVSREELGKDLPFYQNLDLLVFDAQYELEDLLNKHDWGHSSATIGVDLALRERIRRLVLIHHDPWASDDRLHKSLSNARGYAKANLRWHTDIWKDLPAGPEILSAYDGLELEV